MNWLRKENTMAPSPAFAADPGHRITLAPEPARIQVLFKGIVVADTVCAIRMQEGSYPDRFYVPRADCRMEYFIETARRTKCPFKGTARYWSLKTKDGEAENAVWFYDDPFNQITVIDRHVAFHSNKVEIRSGAVS
jgi:uncharacterized protein (DUF427 family)